MDLIVNSLMYSVSPIGYWLNPCSFNNTCSSASIITGSQRGWMVLSVGGFLLAVVLMKASVVPCF